MKFKRRILILCLIIGILFTISSVSASDLNAVDDANNLESVDELQTIDENNNEEIVRDEGDGTFQELQDMIANAPENSTITLDKDYIPDVDFYKTNSMGIKINKSLTIDGKGHTLNADGKGRILLIINNYVSVSVILKNIKFINANASSDGGAIYMSNWRNASISNCSFINNTDAKNGGAIYGADCGGSTITNCLFENNTSKNNGGGGAICFYQCDCPIIDCNFTNNSALTDAGAISYSYSKNATIVNCIFRDNEASDSGGAVQFWSSSNSTVSNCTFINNSAGTIYGGALYWSGYGGRLTDCSFEDNHGVNGGAVWFDSSNVVNNCNFTNNVADEAGGAVNWRRGAPNITNCIFNNNSAPKGGALYLNKSSEDSFVSNCDFINNTADVGGAIYNDNSTDGIVTGCNFIENAANNGDGGAIYSSGDIGNFSSSDFIMNSATGNGGAVYLNNGTVEGSKFYNNSAANGAALYANEGAVLNSEFRDNAAGETGGAIAVGTSLDITNAEFSGNTANDVPNDYESENPEASIKITKDTVITAKAASYVINYGGYYSATLKDNKGNPLSGKKVTFILNGKTIGTVNTNANGVAKIKLTASILKAAKYGTKNLVIKYNGDSLYNAYSKTVKITIKKEKTKLTAYKKTFRRALKTKKYSVILKNSKGKVLKKVKVYLRVKGKTFKATTSTKGKAIFKITNLKKKGKFLAKITYKGNAYYLKTTKKVYLRVK